MHHAINQGRVVRLHHPVVHDSERAVVQNLNLGNACMELRAVPGALRTKQSRAASQMSRVRLDGDRRRPQATATSTQIHTPVI